MAVATDVSNEVADVAGANHQAVFLNFFYWEQVDLAAEGISVEERDRGLEFVRQSRARSGRSALPLGVALATAG